MRGSIAKKLDINEYIANDNITESWDAVSERHKLIAQEAEVACSLDGNLNSPDYDVFEEKYCLCYFA